MATHVIDLRKRDDASSSDVSRLNALLTQCVGEPFRLARSSYGDELTLHFGDLRPARSPKLKGLMYGTYVLGVRASDWTLRTSGGELYQSLTNDFSPNPFGDLVRIDMSELERKPPIVVGSRVVSLESFAVDTADAIALRLAMSDGSVLTVLPPLQTSSLPDLEDDGLEPPSAALADWELTTPHGLIEAGSGVRWTLR